MDHSETLGVGVGSITIQSEEGLLQAGQSSLGKILR